MDSTKIKICKICAIFMLTLYLRLATATNIDCNGKSFHCVNSTHFTICVDLGGGVSVTVNNFVIECPPSTVCGVNDHLECTYQIPATTQTNNYPGDETNEFTTEMQKITKTSSDYTNPISTIDETSLTGLFNEYFNTIEVTTYANYAPDAQTYTNEVSEIPEILNNNNSLSNNNSNVLTAMTDLYSFETPSATSAEIHSPIGKIITDRSYVATTIKDIERKVNFSQGPDLNGTSSSMTLMDALHDAPMETLEENASNVINGEANKLKDIVNQFAQINNRVTGTKPISEIIATTEMTLLTHYPRVKGSQNFENSSTRIESTKNKIDQKIHDLISNGANVTEKSLSTTTENSNFNSTRSESKILLSNKADLILPKSQNITLINTLSPLELNVSETNVTYDVKNMPSTLEPTITPSEYVAETLLVTTKSGVNFNDNEILMPLTRGTYPTSHNPITLENQVSDNLESKSTSNTINMTSLDFKLISEDKNTTHLLNELGKEMQEIKMETISPSVHLNDNTLPLDDDLLETTSTLLTDNLYSDFHTSTIDYPSTVAGSNLSEQKIQDDQIKKLTSYKEHIPLESAQGEIFTTLTIIPNLLIKTTLKSTTDNSTSLLNTLDSTINSIEHVTERMKTTTVYTVLPKADQVTTKVFSSTVYPIRLNYNASETENSTEMEKNTIPARDKYNNSSYKIMTTTPQLNISDQRAEIIGTQTSYTTTEYNKLLSQEENNLQVTKKLYSNDTTLSTENRETNSALYLKEQVVGDKKAYASTPHEQHNLEASVSENIATTYPKIQDLSINTGSSLSNYDFVSTSPSLTFEQTTETEQMTNRKGMKESSTLPYHNTVSYTNLIENEDASEKSSHVQLQSKLSEYRNSGINKMAKNVTTSTGHYETLTYKPGVQKSMQKIIDDTQVENTNPLKKLGTINDSIYYVSNSETITQNEKNITYARDNHNSSYEIIKTTPDLNMNSQGVEVMETSHNTAENNKLLFQEQNTLQITEKPHSNDTTLSIKNSVSNSKLYLKEQVTRDTKTHTSTPHEQHKLEASVSENIATMNPEIQDLSISTGSSLSNYDFISTSPSSNFEKTTETEQMTNRKDVIERSTLPYHNTVPYTNLIENEDASDKSPHVALQPTLSEYRNPGINKMAKNVTTSTRHYETLTYKPVAQKSTQKIKDETQVEKTNPLKILETINDSIYYVSNTETINQNERNITYARENHNSSYEIIKTTPDFNINSQGVKGMETSHNTTENNKLLSQEQNTLQMTEKPYSKESIEKSESNSQLYLKEQVIRDNKTHISTPHEQHKVEVSVSENISTMNPKNLDLSNHDFLTTSLLSTFEEATEIEHVTNGKEALGSNTTQYHNTVPYAYYIENEDATEKSPQVAFLSTQSEYHISTIKNQVTNETIHKYKPDVQNFMQMMNDANNEQIETTKPLYNLNAIKDSISYASNTENITEMEMNTTFTHHNHISSFEIKITTPQLNRNSQGMEATESSPTTIESYYLKKLLSQENVLQIAQNPNSNDDVENNLSKSQAYLDDQQSGYNKIYTSPQHGQHKSEASVLDNIRATTSKSNYDFIPTSPSSTFYLATEIEQVTGGKEATGMSTIPYYNTVPANTLSEHENKSEKLPPVAFNSSKSEYRIADITESANNETTPTLHYENINYKPGVPNIMHKIIYDTQIESTKPINSSGAAINSDVTPSSVYHVVSNINISESNTIKPKFTPIAVLKSVSESMKIKNAQIYEIHPVGNGSDSINSAASLSQDRQNISWQDVITPIAEHSITNKNNAENSTRVNVASTAGNVSFVEITVNMKNAINNTKIFDKLQDKNPNEMVLLTGIEKLVQGNKSSHTIKDLIHNAGQVNPESKIDESVHKAEFKIQSQEAFNDPLKFTSHSRNIQTTEKSLWEGYDSTRADKFITNDKVLSPPLKRLITTSESKVEDTLSIHNQNTTELVTKSYLAKDNSKYMAKNTTNKVFENNFINVQDNNDQDIHVDVTHIEGVEQKLTDKLINNETEQYFTTTIRNTTNKNVLNKTNEHYFSSIMPSHDLKTYYNEEGNIASPSETNRDLNKIQPVIVDVHYTDRAIQEAKFINVTNEQYNSLSVNFPVQFYNNNDSIKRDYMISDSDIVTSIPTSDRNSDLSHTVVNNRIINNVRKNNEESTNEFRVFNKTSMFVTTKIPTDDTTFTVDKFDANPKVRITTDKNPLDTQVLFDFPSISTGKIKSLDIDSTGDLYKERNKPNDTLKDNNSTGVASNSTEHNKLLKIPIKYLGTATTLPYRPLVLWKNIKQATFAPKLRQTEQKDDLHLNSTHGINYKVAAIDGTKKAKRLTIKPRVAVNVNRRIMATPNIVKIKPKNNTNIEMTPNKRSTNTTLFRCAYRSRGRFADKKNCRKYYICIGLTEPILGECPKNTVFSEIKKQCTKNLSHCIRNNQFRCTQEGRFSDVLRSNIYYICVHYKNAFVRFQFQCKNGFHLNKTSVRCAKDIKYHSQTQVTSLSADSLSNKGSDQSTVESQRKEKKQSKEDATNICKKEGKFPDAEDCRKYYVCTKNSKSVFRRRTKKCDSDEVFHREKKKCVDIDSYEC